MTAKSSSPISTASDHKEAQRGLSRRAVIGAAWTVPGVVVLVASTPAMAASQPDTAVVLFNNFNGWDQFSGFVLQAQVQVEWDSTQAATGLTVSFTVPNSVFNGANPSISGQGWSLTSVETGSASTVFTVSFAGSVAPNGITGQVQLVFGYSSPRPVGSHSFTAVADAANAQPVVDGTSFTVN